MKSLSIFGYLKILTGILLVVFLIRMYNSYVLYKEMLLTEIDWKIEFSKWSLIINGVLLLLILYAGYYLVFKRKIKSKA
jgi:hypothetical protein